MTKVSIIVPFYNSKKYLKRCLDSLVKQSLNDIEIIFVNDGSTDGSEEIIYDYLNKDQRIKLFNKENGGQASARNLGLSKATSDYVIFIDSDDYVEENLCEELYNSVKNGYDIVISDYYIVSNEVKSYHKISKCVEGEISLKEGYIIVKVPRLKGTNVFMGGRKGSTVLGTANIMMAAVLAEGDTVIEYAACEPEVKDLADFLIKMGADIHGAGSPTIYIKGVSKLHGAEHTVIPDRIEAATYAIAAAATQGEVTLANVIPEHLQSVLYELRQANVECLTGTNTIRVKRNPGPLRPVSIATQPYPGFPTDVQAQFMTLMTQVNGISIITERIFESRFMHVPELERMGAKIELEGINAIVEGGRQLQGAHVMSSDLRASAALVIAGLIAENRTIISRIYHLDRGYEKLEEKLRILGADIGRWNSDPDSPNYRAIPSSLVISEE